MRSRSPARAGPEGRSNRPGALQLRLSRAVFSFLITAALVGSAADRAAGAEPIRIAVLTEAWGPNPGSVGLRDGLVALGYRENEQFVIGVRFTQGDAAALPLAARQLVEQGVDLIFVTNPTAAKAAQMATNRIPIVFSGVGDPVGLGLIKSFARPGGNVTGITDLDVDLGPKRLEVFRELHPSLKQVLFPYYANEAYSILQAQVYREAARRLGLVLVEKPLQTREEAQTALRQIRKGAVDGVIVPRHVSLNIPALVLETATHQGIPTMCFAGYWVESFGCLASYGTSLDTGRQSARVVDKILKGTRPADIPVEVDNKIELTINLKAARALGLTVPPELLYRADRVIR